MMMIYFLWFSSENPQMTVLFRCIALHLCRENVILYLYSLQRRASSFLVDAKSA